MTFNAVARRLDCFSFAASIFGVASFVFAVVLGSGNHIQIFIPWEVVSVGIVGISIYGQVLVNRDHGSYAWKARREIQPLDADISTEVAYIPIAQRIGLMVGKVFRFGNSA